MLPYRFIDDSDPNKRTARVELVCALLVIPSCGLQCCRSRSADSACKSKLRVIDVGSSSRSSRRYVTAGVISHGIMAEWQIRALS
jgi:hypothetical protein